MSAREDRTAETATPELRCNRSTSVEFFGCAMSCYVRGCPAAQIYRRRWQGSSPSPVPLGLRTVGWVKTQVDDWIAQRVAEARRPAPCVSVQGSCVKSTPEPSMGHSDRRVAHE